MIALTRGLVLVLALVVLSSVVGRAQSGRAPRLSEFVGMWYSEIKGDGLVNGKPYDIRRELLNNRSDGTKTNTNRYYSAGTVVAEIVATYSWEVDNGVYWAVCQTVISNRQASTCSNRNEYDIISVGAREIRYKSRASGTTYSNLRVTDDFRLP